MPRKPRPTGTTDANTVPAVPTTFPEILGVHETAQLLGVPPSTIYEMSRFRGSNRGNPLPYRRVGRYLKFIRSEVMDWLLKLPQEKRLQKRAYHKKEDAA